MNAYSPLRRTSVRQTREAQKEEQDAMIIDAVEPEPDKSRRKQFLLLLSEKWSAEHIKTWLEIIGIMASSLGLGRVVLWGRKYYKRRKERDAVWHILVTLPEIVAEVKLMLDVLRQGQERIIEQQNQQGAITRQLASDAQIPMWRSDKQGLCVEVNRALESTLGVPEKEILGFGWERFVHPDDRPSFVRLWRNTIENIIPINTTCRYVREDKKVLNIRISGQAYYDAEGKLAGYVGSFVDITDDKDERSAHSWSMSEVPVKKSIRIEKGPEE